MTEDNKKIIRALAAMWPALPTDDAFLAGKYAAETPNNFITLRTEVIDIVYESLDIEREPPEFLATNRLGADYLAWLGDQIKTLDNLTLIELWRKISATDQYLKEWSEAKFLPSLY